MDPDSISFRNAKKIKENIASSADHKNILTNNAQSNNIRWLTASTVAKKDTSPENALTTKKDSTSKVDHVSDVVQFDTF